MVGKRNSNPLSQARGKRNKHENVWFRRSKHGYSLFVQYYMGQPSGTIANIGEVVHENQNVTRGVVYNPNPNSITWGKTDGVHENQNVTSINKKVNGGGMSRAARRRNKKKKQQNDKIASKSLDREEQKQSIGEYLNTSLPQHDPPSLLVSTYHKLQSTGKNTNFEAFLDAMSLPLPLSFRIRKQENDVDDAIKRLAQPDFSKLLEAIPFGNTTLFRAKRDDSHTAILSKESLKLYPPLKEFLVESSQSGVLARQEIGSMLPVLALASVESLKSGSRVLDMCASPGSKTLQALEIVGPKGRVVANDVSESRLDALKQALERSGVSQGLLNRVHLTCQDGSQLESPRLKVKASSNGKEKGRRLEFDAVICDVPCSGDGTCRKDRHILPMWKPNHGNDLHSLQVRILIRALKLVKAGGVVCYSTCTLNPIEDEAVVSAALIAIQQEKRKEAPNDPVIELISATLPGDLIARPGIKTWRVADYQEGEDTTFDTSDDMDEMPCLSWYDSVDAAMKSKHAGHKAATLLPSMWPSNEKDLHLERCIRLWPQDKDTGGFFLALLRKNH